MWLPGVWFVKRKQVRRLSRDFAAAALLRRSAPPSRRGSAPFASKQRPLRVAAAPQGAFLDVQPTAWNAGAALVAPLRAALSGLCGGSSLTSQRTPFMSQQRPLLRRSAPFTSRQRPPKFRGRALLKPGQGGQSLAASQVFPVWTSAGKTAPTSAAAACISRRRMSAAAGASLSGHSTISSSCTCKISRAVGN